MSGRGTGGDEVGPASEGDAREGMRASASIARCVASTSGRDARASARAGAAVERRGRRRWMLALATTPGWRLAVASSARAATMRLEEAIASVRAAREDIARARESLAGASEGEKLPLREIARALGSQRAIEAACETIDEYVRDAPLSEAEREAWKRVKDEEFMTQSASTTLPMARRPNDFLCAVFSCYNDPRAPASTDALLSLRLTRDGVSMGLRGDSRITAEGLGASLDDVLEKLDAYLALAPSTV